MSYFGREWIMLSEYDPENEDYFDQQREAVFPNMADRRNVTYGPRSGVMVFTVKKR